jgi:hypothetical protein
VLHLPKYYGNLIIFISHAISNFQKCRSLTVVTLCTMVSKNITTVCCIKNQSDHGKKTCLFSFVLSPKQPMSINSSCHCHSRCSSFSMTQCCSPFILFCSLLMMPVLWLTHRSVFILLVLSPFNVPNFGQTLQS